MRIAIFAIFTLSVWFLSNAQTLVGGDLSPFLGTWAGKYEADIIRYDNYGEDYISRGLYTKTIKVIERNGVIAVRIKSKCEENNNPAIYEEAKDIKVTNGRACFIVDAGSYYDFEDWEERNGAKIARGNFYYNCELLLETNVKMIYVKKGYVKYFDKNGKCLVTEEWNRPERVELYPESDNW